MKNWEIKLEKKFKRQRKIRTVVEVATFVSYVAANLIYIWWNL